MNMERSEPRPLFRRGRLDLPPVARAWMARAAGYVTAGAGTVVVTALIGAILARLSIDNIAVLYLFLLVVLPVAVRYGRGPAVFASVAAVLAFDWFHIRPHHTFTIADPAEWIALLLFLSVAIVTSQLAAAQRQRADEARRREREAWALHRLGLLLANADDLDTGLADVAAHLGEELDLASCAVLLPAGDGAREQAGRVVPRAVARGPLAPPAPRAPAGPEVAEWIAPGAGAAAGGLTARHWIRVHRPEHLPRSGPATPRVAFVALRAGERTVGQLRLVARPAGEPFTPEDRRLIDAAAGQLGLAIERDRLRREAVAAEVLRRTDDARRALLASVSHDLRTPLASIKASAESLLQSDVTWTEGERHSFAGAIAEEADRLNRLVQNLLDMSRIEAGALRPDREWYPVDALVDDVLGHLRVLTARHTIVVDVPDDLPPVPLDYVQMGQVFYNLIENAVKYTPPGSEIRIEAVVEPDGAHRATVDRITGDRTTGDAGAAGRVVRVAVTDDGPGIPADALPRVFDKFFRVSGGDTGRTPGSGLGLAIARGLVEAHGGTIDVESPPPGREHGTRLALWLPLRPADLPRSLDRPDSPDLSGSLGPSAGTSPGQVAG